MPQFCILRFSKCKGGPAGAIESHHERLKKKYASNPEIDTSRSKGNIHLISPKVRYRQEIDNRIEAAGCTVRKDSIKFVDTLITASPEFFKGKNSGEIKRYFERATDFHVQQVGRGNIFAAVVHMDEKTPHLHLCFVPLTYDNRLSAKDIIGNRVRLSKWQDDFHAHMVKAYPDLERGEPASETGRRHIPTRVFKQAVRLNKQIKRIRQVLNEINPLNVGKKRDELISLMQKFFPDMEDFQTQVKKYKKEFERQEQKNAQLTEEMRAGNENKIKTRLEFATLQSEYRELLRDVEALPEAVKEEIRSHRKKQIER